jgi:hypothetical protein
VSDSNGAPIFAVPQPRLISGIPVAIRAHERVDDGHALGLPIRSFLRLRLSGTKRLI